MSPNEFVNAVKSDPDLKTRARQLAVDSIAILRKFDPLALGIAIVTWIVLAGTLGIGPFWPLVLAVMTYAGTTLLRPHPKQRDPEPILSEGEVAYSQSLESCARILTRAKEIADPTVRRQVRAVQGKFTNMLDVMNDDQRFTSTSDYYSVLVHPFERLLSEYVRLSSRKVPGAAPQLRHFEREVVPRTGAVAEAFYQDYHQQPLIDLAALMEIHRLNLDSLSPDEDAPDDEVDDELNVDEEDEERASDAADDADVDPKR